MYSYVLFSFLFHVLYLHFAFSRHAFRFLFSPFFFVALAGFLVGAVAFSTLDDPLMYCSMEIDLWSQRYHGAVVDLFVASVYMSAKECT